MPHFADLLDLASERLGGAVLFANDEFFALKENLLREASPVFIPDRYTDRGKWMDGWETRRRRTPGHDWCILRLGVPGAIHGVDIDTAHFKGNYPEAASLDGCALDRDPSRSEAESGTLPWTEILPRAGLLGDTRNLFPITDGRRFTHLRLHIFPDGGVARLRVHGEVIPDRVRLVRSAGLVDLAAAVNGGAVLKSSDSFFGGHQHLILPGPSTGMHDGWETRRQRRGCDWVLIRLGLRGTIRKVEVDTSFFKGNYADRCSLQVVDLVDATLDALLNPYLQWSEILPPAKLGPDAVQVFAEQLRDPHPCSHARFRIYPDGGVARLRLWGEVAS
jgi:allantoicase